MKKILKLTVLTILLLGFTQISNARVSYYQGDIDLFLGTGATTGLGFCPVYLGTNYMIMDFLSVGAEAGFRMDSKNFYTHYNSWGHYQYKRNGFVFVTHGDYHFNELLSIPPKYDVYAGVDVGIAIFSDYMYEGKIYNETNNYILAGLHVGARWMFKRNLGLNLQTGFRTNDDLNVQFGLTFKL
jgi:hypothetical protein